MRFAHMTLAVLVSTGCVLASTAEAQAQSCNNFSPQWHGNWNDQVGANWCGGLTNVSVTVAVAQDIRVASSSSIGNYNGFSMQLNMDGAKYPNYPQLSWTQYIIRVDTQNALDTPGVDAFTQIWPSGPTSVSPNPVFMGAPTTVNNAFLTIPAGTVFSWVLNFDQYGNNTSCTFSATDTIGTHYTTVTTSIPSTDIAPVYGGNMEIIGYNNGSFTTFQSGAGLITYKGTSLSPSYIPGGGNGCANNGGPSENSNMVYGPLVVNGNTATQTFSASEVANFRTNDCEPSSPYPSGDWAPGDYKAECPVGAPVYGVSRQPGTTWSEDIECGLPQPIYQLGGNGYNNCYARTVDLSGDNRGYTGDGDWDPGSYKTECGEYEYVAGVSQSYVNGDLTSILCCSAPVYHNSCDTQVFYNSDSLAQKNNNDWDPSFYKGQCQPGQYVAGISTPAFSYIGVDGAAHALLCCSQ